MQPLRLFVFLASIAGLRAYVLSPNLVQFYCVVNGVFSNREQVQRDGANGTEVEARVVPVLAPKVSKNPVLYVEESINKKVVRALVLIVTERAEDEIVFTDPHNFAGNTDIKAGAFDVDRIKSLTRKDLQGQPDCMDAYTHVAPFVFFLNWPDCNQESVDEQRASYGAIVTCDRSVLAVPTGAPEGTRLEPYKLKRQGRKFPLENAPDNYSCHCDKKKQ